MDPGKAPLERNAWSSGRFGVFGVRAVKSGRDSRIAIGSREVGPSTAPFVIAEISANHNSSLENALRIVDAAADAGASAIKLQTYTPDTITLDVATEGFLITGESSPWYGRSLHDLYAEAHTPWEWHEEIFECARGRGLECFSTPFDESAVDFLEALNVSCYKIASFEITYLRLIEKVAATGKPLLLSTGMASVGEIAEAVDTARSAGCEDIVLLKCTSAYPASAEDINLATIPHMSELFGCQVGVSDHTLGTSVSVAAVAMGATVVEKHLTLARADGGPDSAFSMEPEEMRRLVADTQSAWAAVGSVSYGPTASEMDSLRFRRSCYVAADMKAGDVFTADNLRIVRPGYGLAPRYHSVLIGKRVNRDATRGEPVSWDMIG